MHVDHAEAGIDEDVRSEDVTVRHHHAEVGRECGARWRQKRSPRGRSGWRTSMSGREGRRASPAEAPAWSGSGPWGRSGWVTTAATSCPPRRSASSDGTANSGVPKKTIAHQGVRPEGRATSRRWPALSLCSRRYFAREGLTLQRTQVIEKQDAVEVVDLVLDGAGPEPARLHAVGHAVPAGGLEHDPLRAA